MPERVFPTLIVCNGGIAALLSCVNRNGQIHVKVEQPSRNASIPANQPGGMTMNAPNLSSELGPDDCATTVCHRAIMPTVDAKEALPPSFRPSLRPAEVALVVAGSSDPPPRDTVVDPPSRFRLFCSSLEAAFRWVSRRIAPKRVLTNHLPATTDRDERGEYLLVELFRLPTSYLQAIHRLSTWLLDVRARDEKRAPDDHAEHIELFVHFVISRCIRDKDGMIPLRRLRDVMVGYNYQITIVPALRRLEKRGLVEIVPRHAPLVAARERDLPKVKLLVLP